MTLEHEIYEKYRNGDPLTDNDLIVGIRHYKALSALAGKSGPVFRLVANEAYHIASALEGFQRARNEKR